MLETRRGMRIETDEIGPVLADIAEIESPKLSSLLGIPLREYRRSDVDSDCST
jgi:hypothetical protein